MKSSKKLTRHGSLWNFSRRNWVSCSPVLGEIPRACDKEAVGSFVSWSTTWFTYWNKTTRILIKRRGERHGKQFMWLKTTRNPIKRSGKRFWVVFALFYCTHICSLCVWSRTVVQAAEGINFWYPQPFLDNCPAGSAQCPNLWKNHVCKTKETLKREKDRGVERDRS
jgi:hypothetical protein